MWGVVWTLALVSVSAPVFVNVKFLLSNARLLPWVVVVGLGSSPDVWNEGSCDVVSKVARQNRMLSELDCKYNGGGGGVLTRCYLNWIASTMGGSLDKMLSELDCKYNGGGGSLDYLCYCKKTSTFCFSVSEIKVWSLTSPVQITERLKTRNSRIALVFFII